MLIKNENCGTCEKASVCKYKDVLLESIDVVKEVAEKYDWLDIKLVCHNYLQDKQNIPLFRGTDLFLSNGFGAVKDGKPF